MIAVHTVLVTLAILMWQKPGPAGVPAPAPAAAPQNSLMTDQYQRADAAVLVKRVEVRQPKGPDDLGSTTYEIVQVPRSSDKTLTKGMRITIPEKRDADKSGLVLLLGKKAGANELEWRIPQEINSRRYNYLTHAPAPDADAKTRLLFYIGRLEDSDDVVAADAFAQVAAAPRDILIALADKLPHDSLQDWVADPFLPPERLGLYAFLLGLCGNEDDADSLADMIEAPAEIARPGMENVISGYLWLTGAAGLKQIDEIKLRNQKLNFSEFHATTEALKILWDHGKGRIPEERLKESMRLALDRPELSDVVIYDLMCWGDWSSQRRIYYLYNAKGYNSPSIKESIIRYLVASTKDLSEGPGDQPAKHVTQGKIYLEELHRLDPEFVEKTVKKYDRNRSATPAPVKE